MRFDQSSELLTVGQLASRTGVRPDTIRYYERAGLLRAPVTESAVDMIGLAGGIWPG
jgi:hypothetical protein